MSDQKNDQKTKKNPLEELKKIQEELVHIKNEQEEYKNKYLRALADYQNLEKRVFIQREESRERTNKELLLKLLPVLDHLEKASIFIKDSGLQIVKNELIRLLKSEHIEELSILHKEFDPFQAEVIQVVEGEKDNIVIEVLRKGYLYKGKILRVAQVKVTKKH